MSAVRHKRYNEAGELISEEIISKRFITKTKTDTTEPIPIEKESRRKHLVCKECTDINTKVCLTCKYIQCLLPRIEQGKKKTEVLSKEGYVPPKDSVCSDYKEYIYNSAKAVKAMQFYMSSPDNHKAVIALYIAGFNKARISSILTINRSTVHRILAIFT
jgi:hypothetical protein